MCCCGGVGEEDAVGGLPDGNLGDVADVEVARAASVVLQGEVTEAFTAVVGDEFEVAGEIGVEAGIEESNLRGGGEFEGADGSGVGDDGEETMLGGGHVGCG